MPISVALMGSTEATAPLAPGAASTPLYSADNVSDLLRIPELTIGAGRAGDRAPASLGAGRCRGRCLTAPRFAAAHPLRAASPAVDWDTTASPQFQASLSLPHVHVNMSQSVLTVVPRVASTTVKTLNRLRLGTRARLNAILLMIPHPYPGGMSERALSALRDDALALLPTYVVGVHVAKITVSAYQNRLELLQVRAVEAPRAVRLCVR